MPQFCSCGYVRLFDINAPLPPPPPWSRSPTTPTSIAASVGRRLRPTGLRAAEAAYGRRAVGVAAVPDVELREDLVLGVAGQAGPRDRHPDDTVRPSAADAGATARLQVEVVEEQEPDAGRFARTGPDPQDVAGLEDLEA